MISQGRKVFERLRDKPKRWEIAFESSAAAVGAGGVSQRDDSMRESMS
jgi:hypothetical protein